MNLHAAPIITATALEVFDPETGRSLSRPVTFSISPGDLCVLMGPNGVGKSTMLGGIAEILSSKKSTAPRLKGTVRSSTESVRVRLHPQISAPMFALPVSLGDVLSWYRSDLEIPLLQGLDLRRPWDSASGGEKQRVLLSGLFSENFLKPANFELLLLDEPGNHLDFKNRAELRKQVRHWLAKKSNRSVLLVTHDPEDWGPTVTISVEIAAQHVGAK